MKRIYLLIALAIVSTACTSYLFDSTDYPAATTKSIDSDTIEKNETFYYYYDEKISLSEQKSAVSVVFGEGVSKNKVFSIINSTRELHIWKSSDNLLDLGFLVLESDNEQVTDEQINKLRSFDEVLSVSYLLRSGENRWALTDNFSVKLKASTSFDTAKSLADKYGCLITKEKYSAPDVYKVTLPAGTLLSPLKLSNEFYESGLFEFTSPDYILFGKFFNSTDTYYPYQWGLSNSGQYVGYDTGIDINIEQAWDITQGSPNVKVAILDCGIDLSHPDLMDNIADGGYDFFHNLPGGGYTNNNCHGTNIAGIIAAKKDNGIGISGVSPNCKLVSFKVGESYGENDYISPSAIGRALSKCVEDDIDVINCSWSLPEHNTAVENAILYATHSGRNGKGCVIIFGSGNYRDNYADTEIQYPATLPNVMTVGAISYDGRRKSLNSPDGEMWGSCYGNQLNVVAPGIHIATTDLQGNSGINSSSSNSNLDLPDRNYTRLAWGTSMAVPHVAGVAALILSQYPNLAYTKVIRAIELGCTRLSGYSYYNDNENPSSLRNDEVGYGLLNAYGALTQAYQLNQQNTIDITTGIDFTITNNSSHLIDEIYLELKGRINGNNVTFITSDPGGVYGGNTLGLPFYRGETVTIPSNTIISDLCLTFSACSPDYAGYVSIGAEIEQSIPAYYRYISFNNSNTISIQLPSISFSSSERKMLYVNILNN